MMLRPAQILKASRPGFWPTHLWFYVLPLSQRDMFSTPAFWLGCVYVCFPLGLLLYGWNDLFDRDTDRGNPRKNSWLFGARLNDSELAKLPRVIIATQLPFVVVFCFFFDAKFWFWFLAVIGVNALYNWPGWGFKNRPVLDLLNQVGYLLIFVLASWLCEVPQLNAPALWFSALFAMMSHLFGQIMDIEDDRRAGRRTTAVVVGVRASKAGLVLFLLAEAMIAGHYFRGHAIELFMVVGAVFFLWDLFFGFRQKGYPALFSKVFFIGWNGAVVATMHFVWREGIFLLDT